MLRPLVVILLICCNGGCALVVRVPGAEQRGWAVPLEESGLPNLHEVSPGLYRGAQPEPDGWTRLRALGVRTIVNLRDDAEDPTLAADDSWKYVRIPFVVETPRDHQVRTFLQIMAQAERPVFVYCKHGADRTGMMFAVYRVLFEGWKKQEAIDEMTWGGFGFHLHCWHMVDYVRRLDVQALRRELAAFDVSTPRAVAKR